MIWPAIIAGIAAIIAAILGYHNKTQINDNNAKLKEIHILVNARLDEALNLIEELRARAAIVKEAQEIKDNKDDTNAI